MTDLQLKLLDMMRAFHELCVKENLRYYVLGGTALGAARHGGFIPWDDDIDVGMPRSDYNKLRSLSYGVDAAGYCFEFPGESRDFTYPYGKMYDTATTLVEHNRYRTKRGIFIDIFPLDGAGNTLEESRENFKRIDGINNLLLTKTCAIRKERKLFKNMAIFCMKLVPDFMLNPGKILNKVEKESSRLDYDACAYVANFSGNWHEKEISDINWFGQPTECDFDGITVYRPQQVEKYLEALYGDWRTPPPPEKQVSHHDFLKIDLNTPYNG